MKDFQQIGVDKSGEEGEVVKYGCLAWRMEREKSRRQRDDEDDGEGFGIRELLNVGT